MAHCGMDTRYQWRAHPRSGPTSASTGDWLRVGGLRNHLQRRDEQRGGNDGINLARIVPYQRDAADDLL